MVIGKKIKEHAASNVCSYYMWELHYSYSGIKFSIDKYLNGKKHKQVLIPVKNRELAEAVWAELEQNDWRC